MAITESWCSGRVGRGAGPGEVCDVRRTGSLDGCEDGGGIGRKEGEDGAVDTRGALARRLWRREGAAIGVVGGARGLEVRDAGKGVAPREVEHRPVGKRDAEGAGEEERNEKPGAKPGGEGSHAVQCGIAALPGQGGGKQGRTVGAHCCAPRLAVLWDH